MKNRHFLPNPVSRPAFVHNAQEGSSQGNTVVKRCFKSFFLIILFVGIISASFAVPIINPPLIASQTVCTGNSVSFVISAAGTSLTYQWKKGGVSISGATSSVYTISSVVPGDAGSYTCTVSDGTPVTSSACVLTVNSTPAAPTVTTPVAYCQNATATQLTATGTNLAWGGGTISGVAGGSAALTGSNYCDNVGNNNRKTLFTTTKANVTVTSVDYYVKGFQTTWSLQLGIYNSLGVLLATSSTITSVPSVSGNTKVANVFNYTIAAAGNYSIGIVAGYGNISGDAPNFPLTETTGTINVTGVSTAPRCFNNIQFTTGATSTAPTPSTATTGTTNYPVTQTVNGCISPQALIAVNVGGGTVGTPGAIAVSGGTEPNCQLSNGTTTTTYSTTATNASTYNWSLSNASAGTINSAGVMTWANGFAGSANIQVTATGCSGTSTQVIRSVTVSSPAATPATITISAGAEPTCKLTNGTTTTTYTTSSSNSTGYNWTLSNASAGTINSSGVMTWANGFSGVVNIQVTATGCTGQSAQTIRTVNVGTPPSATISYSGSPYCNLPGTATVTQTGNAGGTYSSTTGLSLNTTTGAVNLSASAPGTYTVTYTVTGCSVATATAGITIRQDGLWTGAFNTDWNTTSNWQCGVVPTATSNVVISSGLTNYPAINSSTVTVKDLTLQAGTNVVIAGGTLQIGGNATTAGGKITASNGKVEFNGTAAQTIPASLFTSNIIKDLVISNAAGVTLAGSVRVTGTVGFGNVNNSVLNSNGYLTLVSTSTSIAAVTDVTNAGINTGNTVSGNVTVERYIQGKRSYRFLTAPVTSTSGIRANWMEGANNTSIGVNINPVLNYGTQITGPGGSANGFDVTSTNNPSLHTFNITSQSWTPAPNTSGLFSAGTGFRIMVRGNRTVDLTNNNATPSATTLRATGTLTTGPVTFTKAGGSGLPLLSAVTNAYSYIANPYASSVDWTKFAAANVNDISPTIYLFDPTIYARGIYVSYNGQLNVKSVAQSLVGKDLQSGQAFFVQTTGPNPSITFNENLKSTGFASIFRTANDNPHLNVELLLPEQVTGTGVADGAGIYFSNDYSNSVGSDDSYKFTNQDENIAIVRDGKTLSIEGRKLVTGADSVALKIWQLTQKEYTLKVTSANFAYNIESYLVDRYLNKATPLANGETLVPFSITTNAVSSAADRFKIVFESLATLPVRLTGLKAYEKNKGVQIEWVAESESNVELYEIEKSADGTHFVTIGSVKAKNNPAVSTPYNGFDVRPFSSDNYYRIKTLDKAGDIKESSIMKVRMAIGSGAITVSPNPVNGNTINIVFRNNEAANYTVTLISGNGQKVYTGTVNHEGGSANYLMNTGVTLSKGVYQLILSAGEKVETVKVVAQ